MYRSFANRHWVAVLLTVLACLGQPGFVGTAAAAEDGYYRLRPMDLIKVQVFDQDSLNRDVRISQDLTISLPLIGTVDVRNRTARDLERILTELYRADYLVNPQINVTIAEYAPRSVNVFGAVNSPTSVTIPPEKNFSLLDAIARAGGFSRLANRNRISLTRLAPNGLAQNYTIDGDQLMTGDTTNRWPLRDGDIIFVPEKLL